MPLCFSKMVLAQYFLHSLLALLSKRHQQSLTLTREECTQVLHGFDDKYVM
jgi:hypothetical protein